MSLTDAGDRAAAGTHEGWPTYDVGRLQSTLRAALRGRVASDAGTRALYAADASNYRAVPDLVVLPCGTEDLAAAVSLVAAAGAPVVARGGGTSMAGNAIGGVVIDASRWVNRILDIDADAQVAHVEPGVVLTDLNKAAAAHGLTFGVDPSSGSRATLGGMIANNACGAHSVAWGTTAQNLRGLEVVLGSGDRLDLRVPDPSADPDAVRAALLARPGREGDLNRALVGLVEQHADTVRAKFGQFSRKISGYAVHQLLPENRYDTARLLVGSEGTLAVTLRATLALTRLPPAKALLVLGFADSTSSARSVAAILGHHPLTIESINSGLVDQLPSSVRAQAVAAGLPAGKAWLLIEIGGESAAAAAESARAVQRDVESGDDPVRGVVVIDPRASAVLWSVRRDGTGLATRRADGREAWGGWEDAAVPPQQLPDYLSELDALMARYGLTGSYYGHFGDGCMHIRPDFDLFSEKGVRDFRSFVQDATSLVVRLGGSVSGEHGDGRARSELLARMYGTEGVALIDAVKSIWDPARALNPHMIADPLLLDASLRQREPAAGRDLLTMFDYQQDGGSFATAQRRCVGVGKCRQSSGGVMCPSYQVTREEQHSTRGRAHLLWEMLQGELITDGWRSQEVLDGLDLCLSCKGCLSDCPVNVDMATYKSEFTHQHYKGRPWRRPRSHFSMGWLPVLARAAARAPGVVNALTGSAAQGVLKQAGGIAAERSIPRFARTPFTTSFRAQPGAAASSATGAKPRVLLWPDTFTNYLTPQVGHAAVRVLRDAGLDVVVPDGPVCCGLTWISTGQLDVARAVLRRSMRTLAPHLAAGTPVVGLEPSCTAALKHDVPALLGHDADSTALAAATTTFAQVLEKLAPQWVPPQIGGEALVQVHCHQHAVLGFEPDSALMRAAGISAQVPDSGCCGLAGNFGFEQGHYDVSAAVGERVILPAVRDAKPSTEVLADGFSCRTQIAQGTPRRARHLAELLADGLDRRG